MVAQLSTEEKVIPATIENAAVKVKIASDLVQCLMMAISSLEDDCDRLALARVSDFALVYLIDALDMIGHIMAEDGK